MSQTDAQMLRAIAAGERLEDAHATRSVLERIAYQLESDAKRDEQYEALQVIGKSAFESIAEMVEALECDYDRLQELRAERTDWVTDADLPVTPAREAQWTIAYPVEAEELAELEAAAGECKDREEAEQRIHEDPLSVQVRSGWYSITDDKPAPEEFEILLGTGGPATRIIGELDEHNEPSRARLQAQDWGTQWTDYRGGNSETLLTYCRCFFFGES